MALIRAVSLGGYNKRSPLNLEYSQSVSGALAIILLCNMSHTIVSHTTLLQTSRGNMANFGISFHISP